MVNEAQNWCSQELPCSRYETQAREIERLRAATIVMDNTVERLREELAEAYIKLSGKSTHASDCATSNAPAMDPRPCNCDARKPTMTKQLTPLRRKDQATGYQAAVKDIVAWLNEYAEFELIAAIIEAKFGKAND